MRLVLEVSLPSSGKLRSLEHIVILKLQNARDNYKILQKIKNIDLSEKKREGVCYKLGVGRKAAKLRGHLSNNLTLPKTFDSFECL